MKFHNTFPSSKRGACDQIPNRHVLRYTKTTPGAAGSRRNSLTFQRSSSTESVVGKLSLRLDAAWTIIVKVNNL